MVYANRLSTHSEPNRWISIVQEFVKNQVRSQEPGDEGEEIKVALIDDGLDVSKFEGAFYYPGWPVEGPTSMEGLWYNSSGGHGTHMATMIHTICPRVRLYVAKLGDWRGDEWKGNVESPSTADRAAKVRWHDAARPGSRFLTKADTHTHVRAGRQVGRGPRRSYHLNELEPRTD